MIDNQQTLDDFPVMQMVRTSRLVRWFGRATFIALLIALVAMIFLPWRQTARGTGTVLALDPQERPQPVRSPSKGIVSFVKPGLREGSSVEKDEVVLRLTPFAAQGVSQIETQIIAMESKEAAGLSSLEVAKQAATLQESSGQSLVESLKQDLLAAREKWEQAKNDVTSLQADLNDKQNQLRIAEEVAAQGLVSREELFTKQQVVQSAKAKVLKSENAVQEMYAALLSKEEEIESKMQEIDIKNRSASQKVLESMQKINTIEKEIIDLRNKRGELDRLEVRAPRSGSIQQWFGLEGSDTVKEGDQLFVIVPDTEELAVEMKVSGNDLPLVREGDRVRLQFEGWPAVQFVGWPSVAVGTFGGKVNRVFPTDDGQGNFRVVVTPENHFPREDGWPDDRYLRQGVRQRLGAIEKGSTWIRNMATVERISADRQPTTRKVKGQGQQSAAAQAVAKLAVVKLAVVKLWLFLLANSLFVASVDGQSPPQGKLEQEFAAFVDEIVDLADQGKQELPSPKPTKESDSRSPKAEQAQFDDRAKQSDSLDSGSLSAEALTLADVIASLYRSYPEIARARLERARTNGEVTSAFGAFDTKLHAHTISEPTGFYENYRNGIGAARQTWWGGYVAAGYRIGRDDFQPWYKERQTNEGGEFKVAIAQSLLQGRAIDANRVAVFQASLSRQIADPLIQQAILESADQAASVYWEWVFAGAVLQAQRELLDLAEKRNQQFEIGVKAGKFAEIDLILNRQLVAERRARLLGAEQKFQATAFKLGLFLRTDDGQPLVPEVAWLPKHFPIVAEPPVANFQQDLADALARRPEPRILQLEIQRLQVERRLYCNDLLPQLDLITEASQDVGAATNNPDDKGPFELIIGLQAEVPIQRRKARGKLQATLAKVSQTNEKLRLYRDKIAADLQTSYARLTLTAQIVEQAEISLRAAFDSLDRYRFAFDRGKIDLIYLNLLETKANETEIKLVEAQRNWFQALAATQFAMGLDPLDQAIAISQLADSDRPGPGQLPQQEDLQEEDLQRDWDLRNKVDL